ncbi:MAG: preprotein translocase subunit YajC [Flavobacteriales bacterium]|nr:preprotein translocase subunit YajC [Flavobacteriales bacterium]
MHTIVLQASGGSNPMQFVILMGGMFLIMYFFMIRPQMRRVKEAKKFQESLKTGDRVMTAGGIHGEIIEIGETNVVIKIDQGRMRVEKSGIAHDKRVTEGQEKK